MKAVYFSNKVCKGHCECSIWKTFKHCTVLPPFHFHFQALVDEWRLAIALTLLYTISGATSETCLYQMHTYNNTLKWNFEICQTKGHTSCLSFLYTSTLLGLRILHSKVRKFAIHCVKNYTLFVKLHTVCKNVCKITHWLKHHTEYFCQMSLSHSLWN